VNSVDRYLRFGVGAGIFAVPLDQVIKVIRIGKLEPVRRGPKFLLGQTPDKIPLVSLGRIFDFPHRADSTLAILSYLNDQRIAYQIDRIDGVFRYIEVTPLPRRLKLPGFLRGVVVGAEEMIQIVDLFRLLSKKQRESLLRMGG